MYNIILGLLSSGAFLAIIGWAANVTTRITKIETKQEDLPELLEAKAEAIMAKFEAIEDRLERIENGLFH